MEKNEKWRKEFYRLLHIFLGAWGIFAERLEQFLVTELCILVTIIFVFIIDSFKK
jgi:hypothetical protein